MIEFFDHLRRFVCLGREIGLARGIRQRLQRQVLGVVKIRCLGRERLRGRSKCRPARVTLCVGGFPVCLGQIVRGGGRHVYHRVQARQQGGIVKLGSPRHHLLSDLFGQINRVGAGHQSKRLSLGAVLVFRQIACGFGGNVIGLLGCQACQHGIVDLGRRFEVLIVILDHDCSMFGGVQICRGDQRRVGVWQQAVGDQCLGHVKGGIGKAAHDVSLIERLDLRRRLIGIGHCNLRGGLQLIGMLIFGISFIDQGLLGDHGRIWHHGLSRGCHRCGLGVAGPDALQARGDAFSACLGQRCRGVQQGRTRDRLGAGGLGGIASPQNHPVVLNLGFHPALNLALGNAVQHGGIGGRRFGPEIAVSSGQIAEIFRNRFHRVERVVKPLQCAREGAIGNG